MENRNNNPIAEEIIHNNPTGYGLFAGIGDNFNSAAQAICELADDAISNLRANSDDPDLFMTIVVSFENLGDAVEIGVVDGGTGITNLDSALTIACRDGAQTPLNEHGFGLKHALASCDSSPSQQWSIRTRTKKDAAANQYREVTAPYSMGTSEEDQPMKVFFYPGAGGLPYPTGTAVTVRCPMAKFQTVKPDRKAAQSDFHHLVMYAIEELRYIYAGVLADTSITMKVLEVNWLIQELAGKRVPEEISLMGFENPGISEFQRPSLTTIASPLHEAAEKAVEIVLSDDSDTLKKVRLSNRLIERNSVISLK